MAPLIFVLLLACSGPPSHPYPPVQFVRGGLLTAVPEAGARPVGGGRFLIDRSWVPGEKVSVADQTSIAPLRASCGSLFHVPLGDVTRHVAMGGTAPDTSMAWSPDSDQLAIGSFRGSVMVVDGWEGTIRAERRLAETMVKQVAWSPDGQTLYAAEQSPDAFLRALDPETLTDRWTLRLADHVGTSPAPPGQDLYGIYTLPSAYGLAVLPDGTLLVAATHAWSDSSGVRRNLAQLIHVDASGQVTATWPSTPADITLMHPRVDPDAGLAVVPVGRSADGPPPADMPIGGVIVLRIPDLVPVGQLVVPPLEPYFRSTFLWEAVDLDEGRVLLGLGDGRVRVHPMDGPPSLALDAGAPVLAGDVPIAASIGSGFLHGDSVVFLTSRTHIPFGTAAPELRPPTTHPNENAIWVVGLDGQPRWTWRGPHNLEGAHRGPDGRTLVVGAGVRSGDHRRDLFGALLFDLGTEDEPEMRTGDQRLQAFCATEGPVFFRQVLSPDGRVAVAEYPAIDIDGTPHGRYQVTVLR